MPDVVAEPPLFALRQLDTTRLIPARYAVPDDSVLTRLATEPQALAAIFDLDNATNDRLAAEANLLPGIGLAELVFGIPHYRIINAAFCHAHPMGSRFNGPDRGAWYAGFASRTALAEVIFHKTVALQEVNWLYDTVSYDAYHADLASDFHDLRNHPAFADCLDPDSYVSSQSLAEKLLNSGSSGVIYPSVRDPGGTCIACFRPAIVSFVRKHQRFCLNWSGSPMPKVTIEQTY